MNRASIGIKSKISPEEDSIQHVLTMIANGIDKGEVSFILVGGGNTMGSLSWRLEALIGNPKGKVETEVLNVERSSTRIDFYHPDGGTATIMLLNSPALLNGLSRLDIDKLYIETPLFTKMKTLPKELRECGFRQRTDNRRTYTNK